ncbi:MAG: hypothetical protein WBO34_04295 [Gammaproteobacteria bacterium]
MLAAATQATPPWQQTHAGMRSDEYQRMTRENQQLLSRGLATWSKQAVAKTGAYAPAINVLGATLDLALSDRRYNLNDTGSMGLLLRDSARSSRAVLFEYRATW